MNTFKTSASLSEEDRELILTAQALVNPTKVPGGETKEVGAAFISKSGKIYTGVSLNLACGVGFCAEHSAIADMISHSEETEICTIVAFKEKVIPPCGRCRELMLQISKANRENCHVIVSDEEKVKLDELLPLNWK